MTLQSHSVVVHVTAGPLWHNFEVTVDVSPLQRAVTGTAHHRLRTPWGSRSIGPLEREGARV